MVTGALVAAAAGLGSAALLQGGAQGAPAGSHTTVFAIRQGNLGALEEILQVWHPRATAGGRPHSTIPF